LLVDVGPTTCAPITVSLHPSALSPLPTPAQCAAMYSNGQHQKDESKDSKLLTLAKKFNRFFFNGFRRNECKPLMCCGRQIGLVRDWVEKELVDFSDVFKIGNDRIEINPDLADYESRSQAIDQVLRTIRQKNVLVALKGWRNECYEIKPTFAEPPLFKMERSATCLFGLHQYGIDINGYVNHPEKGLCLWFQRRSLNKPTWPGMMDNFAAGGLSVGFSIWETAIKEASEEANVSEHLAEKIVPAGCVSFFFESERGIFPQTEFIFDLELPVDFVPTNNDGEVDEFELVPVAQVAERICGPDMKTTSCPIVIDFLVRKGIISPENEPNYPELVELLHLPLQNIYSSSSASSSTSSN